VEIEFVAGFAAIVRDYDASLEFYADALGLPLPKEAYAATDDLPGLKHFGLWKLADVAQSCFGTSEWPADLPAPQGSLEFDVASPGAVSAAAEELSARGLRLLTGPREEPWGQTVVRLLSPEGLLIGVTYTPWMHPGP
jgi:catechol 2,3-dioxygenase-like lactoylglutathione lyase family enzyme